MNSDELLEQHPLRVTLAQVAQLQEYGQAEIGKLEAGWFMATALTEPASAWLTSALARQATYHPQMDARTKAAYLMNAYSWYLPGAAIVAYLAAKRVPDLAAGNVALCYNSESARLQVRFLSGRFGCLPDDPAAHHADAFVFPHLAALRDWLRTSLETHLTPLIEQITRVTHLGQQAQWRLVADACGLMFLYAGRALHDEQRGTTEGLAFLKAPHSPLNNPQTSYVTLTCNTHYETFLARGGCCRYYTVSAAGEKCLTCVLHKPEDRNQLLLNYLSQRVS